MTVAYSERMIPSEAIEAVTKMIRGYPNGGANAGASYIGALASVLAQYPRAIAIECADPLRGVARTCKFLPTVADIVSWCEPHFEKMHSTVQREDRIKEQIAARKPIAKAQNNPIPAWCRANLFVPATAPKYDAMRVLAQERDARESYETSEGIWVPLDWYTEGAAGRAEFKRFTTADLETIYRRNDATAQAAE